MSNQDEPKGLHQNESAIDQPPHLPDDYKERQLALDPSTSFICEAPAGSGKTELLTQRFLTLLARVKAPEEIIAITFTRKAAGEMRARILAALQRGMQQECPASEHEQLTWRLAQAVLEHDREYAWALVENPNRLQVLTFDSLCAKLANSLPLYSSFGSPPQVSENADEFYSIAARQLLQTLEQDVPWSAALGEILHRLDNNVQRLEKLFKTMLAKRDEWLPLLGAGVSVGDGSQQQEALLMLEHSLQQVRVDTIQKVQACIPESMQKPLIQFAAFAADNLQRIEQDSPLLACRNMDVEESGLPNSDGKGIEQWAGIIDLLLKADGDWRKSLNKNNGFPPGDNAEEKKVFKQRKQDCLALVAELKGVEGLHELLLDLTVLPQGHFNEDQQTLLNALIQILPVLSAHLTIAFREKNSVDFNEISIKARAALGNLHEDEVSDLALKLDYRIQHLLIDEFQDTSPSQVELLTQLTHGWVPGDGRTLFCVGDAMQSIYGFRGANVGLFIHCIEHGLGHIPLTSLRLTTNFRSQAGVVNWINEVFAKAFPARSDISDGAVKYSPSIAFKEAPTDQAVWVHGFAEGTSQKDEANTVLEVVQQSRRDNPGGSIAILVRSRKHAAHITPLLQQEGLKYRAVDIEPLQENIVIQDLMSLCHALLDASDRVSWLSILRAPWCGLSLVDLEAIANIQEHDSRPRSVIELLNIALADEVHLANGKSASPELMVDQGDMFSTMRVNVGENHTRLLTADGQSRLKRVASVLFESFEQAQRKTLRQWVEGTWVKLGGPACLTNPIELKNAELFFNLLETLDFNTVLKKKHALREAVTRLYAVPDPDADDTLQIMTMHKSKGLEFDTVIIPSLDKTSRPQEPELLRWYERITSSGQTQLLMAPITRSGQVKDATYVHLTEQEKKKSLHENCRLLYVAATRAKKRLHLLAQVKSAQEEGHVFRKPAKSALLYPVWLPVQMKTKIYRDEAVDELNGFDKDVKQNKPRYLKRLPSHWVLPELKEKHDLDDFIPFYEHDNEFQQADFVTQSPVARYIGTLIHRVIQQMGENGVSYWGAETIEHQKKLWRTKFVSYGLPRLQLDEAVGIVESSVNKILNDEQLLWFLSEARDERLHEFPVTLKNKGGYRQMVIDLLVKHGNETWLIDFKTSLPAAGESEQEFFTKEKSTYLTVMNQYRGAIEQLGYSNIKLALYFPLLGKFTQY